MPRIFISYRRQDSIGVTGRIYDRLRAQFGSDAVFMDIDSIEFGVNFREHIDAAVGQCHVVLAVIGPKWVGETGALRRLDDPRDFVRIELESALKRKLPLIPILIDRTAMPGESDLPQSLAPLAYRNAIDVDQGRDFHPHVERLIRAIESHLKKLSAEAAKPPSEPSTPQAGPSSPAPSPAKELTNSLGMTMVRIEPGSFLMGSTREQIDHLIRLFPGWNRERSNAEQPQHTVKITRAFYLGRHPVTQGQFQAVMGDKLSRFKGSADLPVENVSWLDAVAFCNKLSDREKLTAFYRIEGAEVTVLGGEGYRLPTEAEWEYACRAGSSALYPFGDDPSVLGEFAWYNLNSGYTTHPVGQKQPNSWGLHDMPGNVCEWCWDGYDPSYFGSSPSADPTGAAGATVRVLRGGSRSHGPGDCRSASRYGGKLASRYGGVGFRLALGQSVG